jgi:hypothetical protein
MKKRVLQKVDKLGKTERGIGDLILKIEERTDK